MKKIITLFLITAFAHDLNAQDTSKTLTLNDLKKKIQFVAGLRDTDKFKDVADLVLNDPGLYNDIWNHVHNSLRDKENQPIFKNLKLRFKTFQASDSNKTSLGFGYNWNYDINRKKNTDYERTGFLAKINTEGNVAFKKSLNPADFQQAHLILGKYGFLGGTVKKVDKEVTAALNAVNQKLASITDKDELKRSPLWNEITEAMGITNQYHYDISLLGGWEGSQDFSKGQVTYGGQLRFSAKAYSNKNVLAHLNILDYPFALIRFLTGTDGSVEPYGAALPIITIGIDLIKPSRDNERKQMLGTEDQFTRFRFETGFRTLITNVAGSSIFFNAAYRFFNELSAPKLIKEAGLNRFSYLSCTISGADTYFVSYSFGKLPFDRSNNAVYELGFKLNL